MTDLFWCIVMSFDFKKLKIVVEMYNPSTTVEIESLPMQIQITKSGLPAMDNAHISIYGLSKETMQNMTFLNFRALQVNRNKITIYAEDSIIYTGEVTSAYPNFSSSPNVRIDLEAVTGATALTESVPPSSYKGVVPVSQIAKTIAEDMNFTFVDKGVNINTENLYIQGSSIQKLIRLSRDYKFGCIIENNTVEIYPLKENEKVTTTNLNLSKDTGMIGYPSFNQNGIQVKCLLAKDIKLNDTIKIESELPRASGKWVIYSIVHNLSWGMKNGEWSTTLQGSYLEDA